MANSWLPSRLSYYETGLTLERCGQADASAMMRKFARSSIRRMYGALASTDGDDSQGGLAGVGLEVIAAALRIVRCNQFQREKRIRRLQSHVRTNRSLGPE